MGNPELLHEAARILPPHGQRSRFLGLTERGMRTSRSIECSSSEWRGAWRGRERVCGGSSEWKSAPLICEKAGRLSNAQYQCNWLSTASLNASAVFENSSADPRKRPARKGPHELPFFRASSIT